VYNPRSVVAALLSKICDNYWSSTETFEALSIYFKINFDGLKDTVVQLLAGVNGAGQTQPLGSNSDRLHIVILNLLIYLISII